MEERVLKVRLDSDYVPVRRRIRAGWGGLISGATVEVQLDPDSLSSKWVLCRIERWHDDGLVVSKV